jgi:hypothetical protein
MVISPIHLTPLLANLDGMAQRVKKFRTIAHRCEKLFLMAQRSAPSFLMA